MSKIKVTVIYGGMSTEHEVSVVSATNVLKNLDKEKYEIKQMIIEKDGEFKDQNGKSIKNIIQELKNSDVVFPVLHGLNGEDGTIQGMLKMFNIPYVGCGVLASSLGMDKVYTKIIFSKANIPQAKYIYLKNENTYVNDEFEEIKLENDEIVNLVKEKLQFPVFVKPSNSGSSVGVTKATTPSELIQAIQDASLFDKKVLIEQEIKCQEVECAVLGNDAVKATTVGEIKSAENFYSYNAKYNNEESKTLIPANISNEKINEIKRLAIKAFKAIDGKGLARVDFFVEKDTEKVYINEINTMPGFTSISMYPKLWDNEGLKYKELLDKLIELAIEGK